MIVILALCAFLSGSSFVGAAPDPLAGIKEIIYEANQEITKEKKDVYTVTPTTVNFSLGHLDIRNGSIGAFNTIALRGDKQFINQTDGDGFSILYYDILSGLDKLEINLDVDWKVLGLFRGSALMNISFTGETLRTRGSIKSPNEGSCEAVLDEAEITDLGKVTINITPSGLKNWILKHTLSFLSNSILPFFKSTINNHLATIVKDEFPKSDFPKIACQYLGN